MSEVQNLKTIETLDRSPFKFMVATIGNLPTSFVDSMSYYECIAWLVKYLETEVIPTVNNNAEAVAELQAAYVELKNYVDNYFDNLDVQEEINNKLDQMAEDGVLADIIAAYIQLRGILAYDTVNDLKIADNLSDGSFAETYGFYDINDGGSAKYKVRQITNDDIVDEKFIIALADDNLIAELITDDLVNVCQVGGQQNFSTVCNYLLSAGKSVYVPVGSYTANNTIIINNDNLKFICDGEVEFTTENSTFFSIQNQRAIVKFNKKITCPTNSVAIEVCGGNHQVRYCDVYAHYIYTSSIGILINPNGGIGASANTFKWDRINASDAGIKLATGNIGANWANSNFFIGGQISAPYGVVTRKGTNQTDAYNGNVFEHIIFDGNPTITIALDLQFCKNDWFTNLRISENRGGDYDYQLDACSFLQIENFSFINIDRINILNSLGLSYPNFFKCAYIRDSGDHWLSNEVMELNGKFILQGRIYQPNIASISAIGDDNQTFTTSEFYNDKMIVRIGCESAGLDLKYYLPDIFERRGITEFYLLVTNKPDTTRLQVYCGTTWYLSIPAAGAVSNGVYRVTIGGASFTGCPTVKTEKMTLVNT